MRQYTPDPELDNIAKLELTAPATLHFYGGGRPLDNDGKDAGLKEVFSGWNFPKSNDKYIVILPKWLDGVHAGWSQVEFEEAYDGRLAAHGLSQDALKETVAKLNEVLGAFYPFQRDRKKAVKTLFSERGFNKETKGIDTHGTNNFYYALQMRKILAKAGRDFPTTFWSLHIHKHSVLGGGEGIFIEKVYHTIQIDLAKAAMPGWWDPKKYGTGSFWHVWEQGENPPKGVTPVGDRPIVTTGGTAATLGAPVTKQLPPPIKAPMPKRKGSAAETLSGLKEFAESTNK